MTFSRTRLVGYRCCSVEFIREPGVATFKIVLWNRELAWERAA